ncbi:MAG: Peptidyl-tRNA hydrolase [Firmicutes bacterium]|nr:Peptidyl-tRNA hydrolase [Bacillota bacterium]MDI6705071.1 aminoacyl-tRNA hydrolase [Bacillota bacterium]
MFIIAGLGNPGRKYMYTRHNVGFDVVDLLAKRNGIKVASEKFKGLCGKGHIEGRDAIIIKPMTYMNLSGMCILDIVDYYKIGMDSLMVVYDDVDLAVGQIRIRRNGSSGTHNGMRSIVYQLRSEEFPRLRIGIGRPMEDEDIAHYVLDRFSAEDRKIIDVSIERAAMAIETFIGQGIEAAMSSYNG